MTILHRQSPFIGHYFVRLATLLILTSALLLAGCDNTKPNQPEPAEKASSMKASIFRNKSFAQVSQGAVVFKENCQVCHGVAAAGVVKNWQEHDSNGNLPAPPLNGNAHAWHHSQEVLLRTVDNGGAPVGGTMPPFKDVLSKKKKLAVLAYIKSLWPDELYAAWQERFGEK